MKPKPTMARTEFLVGRLLGELFPDILPSDENTDAFICLISLLNDCAALCSTDADVELSARALISSLSDIRRMLLLDAAAMYDGDPAATSIEEVMLCYPGFFAIAVHRMAHVLYDCGVPFLPRMMSEYAHRQTGIDIHPGATIGSRFCIDHGTGIVIGETATIGDRVSLYQGVTLGARGFERDWQGRVIRVMKRHPTVCNGTVIFADATVLGGDTVIGENCVIGAKMLVTASLPSGTVFTKSTMKRKEK